MPDIETVPAQTESTTKSTVSVVNGPVVSPERSIKASWLPGIIAIVLTGALIGFGVALILKAVPAENKDLINTLFGALIVGCTTAWNYYYTSNQQSEARNAVRASKER